MFSQRGVSLCALMNDPGHLDVIVSFLNFFKLPSSIQTPLLALKKARSKWYVRYSLAGELDQQRFSIAHFVLNE